MNANTFYVIRRDSFGSYGEPRYIAADVSDGSGPYSARPVAKAARYVSINEAVVRLAESIALGARFSRIVRVTEVPGTETREVIPEGQAYEPKDVQYAIYTGGGNRKDSDYFIDTSAGARVSNPLSEATLYESQMAAIEAWLANGSLHGNSTQCFILGVVPVRLVKSPSTFTETVVE